MQHEYDLMGKVIGLAMRVHSILGPGFLESVYHKALAHELTKAEIPFESKKRIIVRYGEIEVGEFEADFLVDEDFIVEIKAVQNLVVTHELQTVNYLTATQKETAFCSISAPKGWNIRRNFEDLPNWRRKQ